MDMNEDVRKRCRYWDKEIRVLKTELTDLSRQNCEMEHELDPSSTSESTIYHSDELPLTLFWHTNTLQEKIREQQDECRKLQSHMEELRAQKRRLSKMLRRNRALVSQTQQDSEMSTPVVPQSPQLPNAASECQFTHNDIRRSRNRTKLCKFFQSGGCRNGIWCHYAHNEGQRRR